MTATRSRAHAELCVVAVALFSFWANLLTAQAPTTGPRALFGHDFGDDYWLANYRQLIRYWQRVAEESDRMRLERIGTTTEGRPMWMAIVSAPENLRRLTHYQHVAATLARAEVGEMRARALAAEGRAVVWIDGGLHAREPLGAQQLGRLVRDLMTNDDKETRRIRRDVITLVVPVNPDGMELISNWYMHEADSLKRDFYTHPGLEHPFVGHDNNRDFFMASQTETRAIDSILFRAWYPQIVYNHHQGGGGVMEAPPLPDQANYHLDPLVTIGIDLVGQAMHARFAQEEKHGVWKHVLPPAWWNGSLSTTAAFHNMIGIFTETRGEPTPLPAWNGAVKVVAPSAMAPLPLLPQPTYERWHLAQSMDYVMTANRAVLDFASRYRETVLHGIYRMGRSAIEQGSRDSWTLTAGRILAMESARASAKAEDRSFGTADMVASLHSAPTRDPRAYIIPADQPDFLTATKFVNTLIKTGIVVYRATAPFTVNGKTFPMHSYVVKTAQAFRPHVLDMFEPQLPPHGESYDLTGWTLAYQMGIRFDRILDSLSGPFVKIAGFALPPQATVPIAPGASGYTWSATTNDAFCAAQRVLAAGASVSRLPNGDFQVAATSATSLLLTKLAADYGIMFTAVRTPSPGMHPLRAPRIGIVESYSGSEESGWYRFLLDQFTIPYEVLGPRQVEANKLRQSYDVLIIAEDQRMTEDTAVQQPPNWVPTAYRNRWGKLRATYAMPALRRFLREGGTLLAVNGIVRDLAQRFALPITDALVDSAGRPLSGTRFRIFGSVLRVRVDTAQALARGLPNAMDLMWDRVGAIAFRLGSDAAAAGVQRVAWFDTRAPLRSGWGVGQELLEGASAVVEARIGEGRLVLYGMNPNFRYQSHGAFKLLFNALYP